VALDFAQIVTDNQSMVFSVAVRFLRDREGAAELAQDVFLQLYEKLSWIESQAHATAWLRRAICHRCIDEARKRRLRPRVGLDAIPEPVAESRNPDLLLNERLRHMVAELPESARMVVPAEVSGGSRPDGYCGDVEYADQHGEEPPASLACDYAGTIRKAGDLQMNLDEELIAALRREAAPDDFAAGVLAKTTLAKRAPSPARVWAFRRPAIFALAAALILAIVLPSAIYEHSRQQRGREARDQLIAALSITRVQLQQVQKKIRQNTRHRI
jgi:RNA polymerase sigma-70 factor (ECF subfamily)